MSGLALTTRASYGNAEQGSCRRAQALGPTEGGCRLALRGAIAGIASADSKTREKIQAAPMNSQGAMIWEQVTQDINQLVRALNRLAKFLQQSLQILLCGLLAMEALLVMKRLLPSRDL